MPRFEVQEIKFEFSEEVIAIRYDFFESLKIWAPRVKSNVSSNANNDNVIITFKKSISLNTLNMILSDFVSRTDVEMKEMKYMFEEKKIIIIVK